MFVPFRSMRSVHAGIRAFSLSIYQYGKSRVNLNSPGDLRCVISVNTDIEFVRWHEGDGCLGIIGESQTSYHLEI